MFPPVAVSNSIDGSRWRALNRELKVARSGF